MKRILCLFLCIAFVLLTLAACGEKDSGKKEDGQLFTVVDTASRESLTANFTSSDSDESLEVSLTKGDSPDEKTASFTCHADTSVYDRVTVSTDRTTSEALAYNNYVTTWDLSSGRCYPGVKEYTPEYDRKTFDYQDRTKDVLIWKPDDYDASSKYKYSVIYMTDGQNLFDRKATATGSWGVAESVRCMMENGGEKCIIVGVENLSDHRDDELTPNIGDVRDASYEDGHGEYFSDFVVDTVMPYINKAYNVYTDRKHTHICGSSSGGIESFYIAMEHPDRFASVGAFSPAFILYDDQTWVKYLKEKDFSAGYPTVYLYCGNSKSDNLEQMLYKGTVTMPDNLKEINYPTDKVITKLYDDGLHNEMYWRAVFPDYLKYAFPLSESTPTDSAK